MTLAFAEPWEAQVFALAVALEAVDDLRAAHGADYGAWLAALEARTDAARLAAYRTAWASASDRTPHGRPIELTSTDFHTSS